MTILQHVGESPIAVFAVNQKHRPELFDLAAKWMERGWLYVEDFAPLTMDMDEEEHASFKAFAAKVPGLFDRYVVTTKEKWLPALKNGQRALVVVEGPETSLPLPTGEVTTALPTIELALVTGVSDKDLLTGAVADYFDLIDDTAAALREADEEVPEWKIPRPEPVKGTEGMYYYPLPAEVGEMTARKELLTLAVGDETAVITSTPAIAKQILESRPAKLGGVATDLERPLAGATYIDVEKVLVLAERWAAEGLKKDLLDPDQVFRGPFAIPGPDGPFEPDFDSPDFGTPDFDSTPSFDPAEPGVEESIPEFEVEPMPEPDLPLEIRSEVEAPASFVLLDPEAVPEPDFAEEVDDLETKLDFNRRVFQLLRCVKGYSSVTYQVDDSLETHFRWEFTDVDE